MNMGYGIEQSPPHLISAYPEKYMDALVDFTVGVGGVRHGDRVADVSDCNARLASKLRLVGARVSTVDGWPSAHTSHWRLKARSVDVAFAYMVLHRVGCPVLLISELKRSIRPGGRLVITDMSKTDENLIKSGRRDPWVGFYISDIRHWLRKAGFSNIIVNPVPLHLIGKHLDSGSSTEKAEVLMATGTVM